MCVCVCVCRVCVCVGCVCVCVVGGSHVCVGRRGLGVWGVCGEERFGCVCVVGGCRVCVWGGRKLQ